MRNSDKLRVAPEAESLAVAVYLATQRFPQEERFGLTAQIRRAVVSVGSNIFEGSHRQGNRAFVAFLHQALGSAAELQFQLRLARRLEFGKADELTALLDRADHLRRMIIRLILALRKKGD